MAALLSNAARAEAAERLELLAQCKHPDPLDPNVPLPDRNSWTPRRNAAFDSSEMQMFRELLALEGAASLRDAVLDDVKTFFDQPTIARMNPAEFEKVRSWALNLLWYAYLQPEGFTYPITVAIALTLPVPSGKAVHLDFGSGVGVTSQLFQRLGYAIVLADAEPTLLDFARFRLERRGQAAKYINLLEESPPAGAYDVITAIDTLSYVPDLETTLAQLHRALRPHGVLFANFPHVLKGGDTGGWRIHHHDQLDLRRRVHRIGFEPVDDLDRRIIKYIKVDPTTTTHRLRGVRDSIVMNGTLRATYRSLRSTLRGN